MFKRFWLWLGRILGKLLVLVLAIGIGGWAIGAAYYGWKFSGPVSTEEQIPPDEAALTQSIIEDAIRVVEQHRDNTRV
ncbi:MAG: catalase family protein, partial [Pseudomonadales bacterium]